MMVLNSTCVNGNSTSACPPPSSSVGLAVGLSLFFLLLLIGVGLIVFKYHSKIWTLVQFGQRGSQEKDVCAENPQTEEQHYTSMSREQTVGQTVRQTVGQTPIYENLTIQTGYKKSAAKQSRSPDPPEEDVYLQCDPIDEGIYSNDPAYNSTLPDPQEEDLYIVPNS
ncbi:protein GAPT [Kryptolebias marmoratus]|uniref:protein GAPT n=1 Tax=Kryptolebias marmoratus TaxID=37003 RepID=UPI0007F8752B|nr:protein GAPT [Kryptolebias marmoratus]